MGRCERIRVVVHGTRTDCACMYSDCGAIPATESTHAEIQDQKHIEFGLPLAKIVLYVRLLCQQQVLLYCLTRDAFLTESRRYKIECLQQDTISFLREVE